MDIYRRNEIGELIKGNPYPGRGILMGITADGACACAAYFIMGRSANSRNRIFEERDGSLYTRAYDESKVEDPSLIIYRAVCPVEDACASGDAWGLIVANGDHSESIREGLAAGLSFEDALEGRTFEPDAPNLTPRISGLMTSCGGDFGYSMSILKSIDAGGSACVRNFYHYPGIPGLGHLIHTYETDGNPLPTFQGEPRRVLIPDDIDQFTETIWDSLDGDNRISLYVRFMDLNDGTVTVRLVNRNI